MEEKKWALRRSPTVPQEVQIEPATGHLYGLVDGRLMTWHPGDGFRCGFSDHNRDDILIPLQVPPKKALRCWASDRGSYVALNQYDPITHNSLSYGWVEMIERAPGDKLAEAVREFDPAVNGRLWTALREYDEATK